MAYYTGIDVSLRSVSICIVNDKGEVCLETKVAAEIGAIVDRLRRFSSEVKSVGFEAGSLNVNGEFFRSDAEVSCDLYGAGGHVQSRLLADRATPSPSVFRRSCARQLTSVYSAAVPPCSGVDKKEVIPSSSRRRCTKQSNRDFYDECERPMAM